MAANNLSENLTADLLLCGLPATDSQLEQINEYRYSSFTIEGGAGGRQKK